MGVVASRSCFPLHRHMLGPYGGHRSDIQKDKRKEKEMIEIPVWTFVLLIVASIPAAFFALMLVGALVSMAIMWVMEIFMNKKEKPSGTNDAI